MTEHIDTLINSFNTAVEEELNVNNPCSLDNSHGLLDDAVTIIGDMQEFRTKLSRLELEKFDAATRFHAMEKQRDELIETNAALTRMLENRS